MSKIPTCLIEKNPLLREGLKSLLVQSNFDPLVEYSDVDTLEDSEKNGKFRLAIIGTEREPASITRQVRMVKSKNRDARVVVLSEHANRDSITCSFSAGADGFLEKSISAKAFIASLNLVMTGEKVMPTSMASVIVSGWKGWISNESGRTPANMEFSLRELDIVKCLAEGMPNKMIANHLEITEATVKVHLKAVLRKLGFSNRTQIAIWAVNNNMAEPVVTAAE